MNCPDSNDASVLRSCIKQRERDDSKFNSIDLKSVTTDEESEDN